MKEYQKRSIGLYNGIMQTAEKVLRHYQDKCTQAFESVPKQPVPEPKWAEYDTLLALIDQEYPELIFLEHRQDVSALRNRIAGEYRLYTKSYPEAPDSFFPSACGKKVKVESLNALTETIEEILRVPPINSVPNNQ